MGRVSGKVAIVTGGASGIGRGCAQLLAAEGAKVIIADLDRTGGLESCQSIRQHGNEVEFFEIDVAREQQWASLIAHVRSTYGALHILVNNAAICVSMPLLEMSADTWHRQLAINLDSVFFGTKSAIPLMSDSGGGSIVNLSSTAGFQGIPGLTGYCATKGGVRLFSKAAALECAQLKNNIRVNSVHPGGVETPIWLKMANGGDMPNASSDWAHRRLDEARKLTASVTPLGRAGLPNDIATGVLYLASDESAFVTGTELVIDGGVLAG
jgi:NAD(P)-dependent dehydrogenase (short-subunit alcohol dehydrogenase family)